jgi:3-dehydroquinate synthase
LAVIKDLALFELLEIHGPASISSRFQDEISASILDRSVGGMLEELQPNLYEDELARKVDFGHTFSYGLETHEDAHLLHGEAVLIDIVVSSILANARNLLSNRELDRLFELVSKLGINLNSELSHPSFMDTLEERLPETAHRVPLLGLGQCAFVNDIKFEEIQSACKILEERKTNNEPIYQY